MLTGSRTPALAVLLLALPALTGCITDAESPGISLDADNGTDPGTFVAPDNRTMDFNAFDETNATEKDGTGAVDHHHDYWLGRDRVEIFSGHAFMDVQPSPEGASVDFSMPAGALVYEGTATLEFLVKNPERHVCDPSGATWQAKNTCTDDNGFNTPPVPRVADPNPPTLKLLYQHASSGRDEWTDAGPLTWGTPLTIPLTAIQTDMPHSTTSLWRYRVVSATPFLDSTLTFDASATIVKGSDTPLWPPHPDFYAQRSSRVVYDGPSETREGGTFGAVLGFNNSLIQQTPGRLISYGTRSLHVWINVTDFEGAPATAPTRWYLYYHNATGDWMAAGLDDAENYTVDKKEFAFVVPVSDDGMDSPYAPDSRWEFVLRGTLDAGLVTCYGGCADYAVQYNMFIVATDREAEAYTPISQVS